MSRSVDDYSDDEELSEFRVDPEDQLDGLDVSVESVNTKKRGRPRISE